MYGAPGVIRTPDHLVRSLSYEVYVVVLFNLLVVMPVAIALLCTNSAELCSAKAQLYLKVNSLVNT